MLYAFTLCLSDLNRVMNDDALCIIDLVFYGILAKILQYIAKKTITG